MTTISYTNQKTGKRYALSTTLTDTEAASAICEKFDTLDASTRNFATELLGKYARAKANGWTLSDAQRYWLHSLAKGKEEKKAPTAVAVFDVSGILRLFAAAAAHLKRPSVKLRLGDADIKIALAGERSRYTGQIMVSSSEFGVAYYGRIDRDGKFYEGKDATPEVRVLLGRLANEPEKTAAEYGKLTGHCCFCGRFLDDERSTEVGYGPVCAERWNLSWGSKIREGSGAVI